MTEIKTLQELLPALIAQQKDKQVLNSLDQFDKKFIANKKLQLIQKIPNQLRPNQPPKPPEDSLKFTEIVKTVHQNTYQYVKQDIMGIILAAKQWEDKKLSSFVPQQFSRQQQQIDLEKEENQISQKQPLQKKINTVEISEKKEQKSIEKIIMQKKQGQLIGQAPSRYQINPVLSGSQIKANSKIVENKIKKYPPFIPNKLNFLDCNANSKHNHDYSSNVSLSQYAQNMVSMTQKSKAQAFTAGGFPGSVIGGNVQNPRQTLFAPQSRLDVQDIMRYTLGVNASTYNKVKQPLQNPFSRIRKRKIQE